MRKIEHEADLYLRKWDAPDLTEFEFTVSTGILNSSCFVDIINKPFLLSSIEWVWIHRRWWEFWKSEPHVRIKYRFTPANQKFVPEELEGKIMLKETFEECKENEDKKDESGGVVRETETRD